MPIYFQFILLIAERNDDDSDDDDYDYDDDETEQLDDLLLHHNEKAQLTRNVEENLKDSLTESK